VSQQNKCDNMECSPYANSATVTVVRPCKAVKIYQLNILTLFHGKMCKLLYCYNLGEEKKWNNPSYYNTWYKLL